MRIKKRMSRAKRDEAIARAGRGALQWVPAAQAAVMKLARTRQHFTADDVWAALDNVAAPDEPRALGIVMRLAKEDGIIIPGEFKVCTRASRNRAPIRVWHSRVYRKAA